MKKIVFLSVYIALNAKAGDIPAQSANYFYQELAPRKKIVLTFTAEAICDLDKFVIQDFESTAKYPSAVTKKSELVRIKTIIANSVSPCSSLPKSKMEKKIVIGPYKTQMTHIHITALNGLQVSTSQD